MTDEERRAFADRAWQMLGEGLAKARAERRHGQTERLLPGGDEADGDPDAKEEAPGSP
jgi:hypothetical protein